MLAIGALCKQVDSSRVNSETASSRMRTGETRLGGWIEGRTSFLSVVGREDGMHDRQYAGGREVVALLPVSLDVPPPFLDSTRFCSLVSFFYS